MPLTSRPLPATSAVHDPDSASSVTAGPRTSNFGDVGYPLLWVVASKLEYNQTEESVFDALLSLGIDDLPSKLRLEHETSQRCRATGLNSQMKDIKTYTMQAQDTQVCLGCFVQFQSKRDVVEDPRVSARVNLITRRLEILDKMKELLSNDFRLRHNINKLDCELFEIVMEVVQSHADGLKSGNPGVTHAMAAAGSDKPRSPISINNQVRQALNRSLEITVNCLEEHGLELTAVTRNMAAADVEDAQEALMSEIAKEYGSGDGRSSYLDCEEH